MRLLAVFCLIGGLSCATPAAESFSVASYNVQNYLLSTSGARTAKPAESRRAVCEMLLASKADVIGLQEIGSEAALSELQKDLAVGGLDLPHKEFVPGSDTNIHVAVLSRFPIVKRRSRTNDSYIWFGKEQRVRRGIAEVVIQVHPDYSFTFFVAHLKSQVDFSSRSSDEAREHEATILRRHIDSILATAPDANVLVAGDLNDGPDSKPVRTIIGRKNALVDLRPAERDTARIAWTHHFAQDDSYKRIDYLLASRGMSREWASNATFVVTGPMWAVASDHRPIVARFASEDR